MSERGADTTCGRLEEEGKRDPDTEAHHHEENESRQIRDRICIPLFQSSSFSSPPGPSTNLDGSSI